MFRETLKRVAADFSGDRAATLTAELWDIDHWFDFAHFKQSASYSAAQLQAAGLSQVEIASFPADGRTRYGDWVVPLAWDATQAELKIVAPESIPLVSYTQQPCSLTMWSAPTPAGGVEGQVVLLEEGGYTLPYSGSNQEPDPNLKGKFLFSGRPAPELKRLAVRHGALGVISDHNAAYSYPQASRPPDKVSWVNVWSDDPYGWPFTKNDVPTFGFSLSARQGQVLRNILGSGQPARLSARVETRHYDGSFDLVTGLIPGRQPGTEVLVFAHLYEVGAQDNAGGCAVVLEAARCLNQLINSGQLPQPQRSIRFMLSWEIYGLLAYSITRPEAMQRVVAALNLDSLGIPPQLCQAQLELHHNPHAQASYTDVLLGRIMEQHVASGEWAHAPFDTTDAVIADPSIGVPTPWLGEMTSSLWHSSLDTPDKIDPQRLAREGAVAASYLYAIANATPQDMVWLAGEVYQETIGSLKQAANRLAIDGQAELAAPDDAWWNSSKRLRYLRDRGRQALGSCASLDGSPGVSELLADLTRQLDGETEEQLAALERRIAGQAGERGWLPSQRVPLSPEEAQAANLVPTRQVIGGLSLGNLPPEAWPEAVAITGDQNPRWSRLLCCALYWVDGQRTLLEVRDLVEQELGSLDVDVFDYFYLLERHGYIRLSPSDQGQA
jgi:hypothetical protein